MVVQKAVPVVAQADRPQASGALHGRQQHGTVGAVVAPASVCAGEVGQLLHVHLLTGDPVDQVGHGKYAATRVVQIVVRLVGVIGIAIGMRPFGTALIQQAQCPSFIFKKLRFSGVFHSNSTLRMIKSAGARIALAHAGFIGRCAHCAGGYGRGARSAMKTGYIRFFADISRKIRLAARPRRNRNISFLRPKKAMRVPRAGLLTQLHRSARLLSLRPMASCAALRITAAVLLEICTPFPLPCLLYTS